MSIAQGPKVLLVDENDAERQVVHGLLTQQGYDVVDARGSEEALIALREQGFDIALCDICGAHGDRVPLVEEIASEWPDMAVVMLATHTRVDTANEAVAKGANGYVTKSCPSGMILHRINQALKARELMRQNRSLREAMVRLHDERPLVGESEQIRELQRLIDRVAPTNASVLITGESGTGKELVAQALHERSHRADKPFIKVSCAALPEDLLEVELFGHERGAFTDAYEARPGRFELADGGTLLLDEVGDISPTIQVKLLRVLQEREFERVGGRDTIQCDVRILASTNRDLLNEDQNPPFREELYYRLNVIPIHVPPLRQRTGDIRVLASHFLDRARRELGKRLDGIQEGALALLERYPWPGNVRELENAIERAAVLAAGATLAPSDFAFLRNETPTATRPQTLRDVEAAHIRHVLRSTKGNRSEAAEILGIHRDTLYRKIRRYSITAE
ncbi:MAG: sigma-54-dependent transcriptional regulator [Armatimonadota bacterium]